jgi:hypothetical protein
MAATTEVLPGTAHSQEQPSSKSMTSSSNAAKVYSIDRVENGDNIEDDYSKANPSRPGFTRHDQKDMYRMGKTQRLQASLETYYETIC